MPELLDAPAWLDKDKRIVEPLFCYCFLERYPMRCIHDHFYTVDGPVTDESRIRRDIFREINEYLDTGVARKVEHLFNTLKMVAYADPLPLQTDRIRVANGVYHMDGTFTAEKEFCNNRLSVEHHADAPEPLLPPGPDADGEKCINPSILQRIRSAARAGTLRRDRKWRNVR